MTRYSRPYLRERYLAQQQAQLDKDALLNDPATAYRALLEEFRDDLDVRDEARDKAA